jgi:hypothetical protein
MERRYSKKKEKKAKGLFLFAARLEKEVSRFCSKVKQNKTKQTKKGGFQAQLSPAGTHTLNCGNALPGLQAHPAAHCSSAEQ